MNRLREKILNWLFGTENIERYIEILNQNINHGRECEHLINEHLETLKEERENIDIMRKLIQICKNHGIDVDKEIQQIEL